MNRTRRKTNKLKIPTEAHLLIRVQLNANTVITITKLKMFETWKLKFPEAKIISPSNLVTK